MPRGRSKGTQTQITSFTQTGDTMLKPFRALANKVNNLCSAHGRESKNSFGNEKGLRGVLAMPFDLLVNLPLKIIVDQIRSIP